jgi:O-methyltransferase involved in polyketide biosynthesis
MKQLATVSGDILEGVSATTLWTLRNRGTEDGRSDGVIRDPWAVTLFDAISHDYRKFGRPNQAHRPSTLPHATTSRPTRWRR